MTRVGCLVALVLGAIAAVVIYGGPVRAAWHREEA